MPLARNACFSASVKLLSFTPRYGKSLESDLPQGGRFVPERADGIGARVGEGRRRVGPRPNMGHVQKHIPVDPALRGGGPLEASVRFDTDC